MDEFNAAYNIIYVDATSMANGTLTDKGKRLYTESVTKAVMALGVEEYRNSLPVAQVTIDGSSKLEE